MAGKLYTDYVTNGSGALLVNRMHPGSRLVRAYAEGRNAKAAGLLATANPHTAGTPANTAWANGWGDKNFPRPVAPDRGHCCT